MKIKRGLKFVALGGLAAGLFALLALLPAAKPGVVDATANPLPSLLSCPNVDGSGEPAMPADPAKLGKVTVADILMVVKHFGTTYGNPGYAYLDDPIAPYNSTSPAGTGQVTVADILSVVAKFGNFCPLVDTQIAKATRAIGDPMFSDILCDPNFATPVNCGGDAQFLTEDATFLASKGYQSTGIDVPGQGVHYVNGSLWDGVFNPVRPEGLVYNDGVLQAQLYYADGDVVGWGTDRDNNKGAVNTDAIPCIPVPQAPPTVGCGWDGTNDGWHWHKNLCTLGIGTPQVTLTLAQTQLACANLGLGLIPPVTCVFPPATNFNCTWQPAVGWMGHLWNWLPNANYTNAVNPGPGGLNECTAVLCVTAESNGRFADCFPDVQNWNAYNCPQ